MLFTDVELAADAQAGLVHAGLEMAQQAINVRPHLKVLYTTGQGVTDGMKALFVEGSEFLPKPYNLDGLGAKIRTMLGGSLGN